MALLWAWAFDSILMMQSGDLEQYGWKGFFPEGVPELAIFADTQNEPASIYSTVEEARFWCNEIGVPFEVVTAGDLANPPPASTGTQGIFTPVFTVKLFDDEDGKAGEQGQLRRQCTARYKIDPMMKRVYELASDRPIEIWMGVSLDEASRMKTPPNPRITYHYPLIFNQQTTKTFEEWQGPHGLGGMSRTDCLNYLNEVDVKVGKSACTFCPYRSDFAWARMKREDPASFEAACVYDERICDWRPGYKLYVHKSRKPLREAYFEAADPKVIDLGFFLEADMSASGGCEEGYCGL